MFSGITKKLFLTGLLALGTQAQGAVMVLPAKKLTASLCKVAMENKPIVGFFCAVGFLSAYFSHATRTQTQRTQEFFKAIENGDQAKALALVEQGIDLQARNFHADTPLLAAVKMKLVGVVQVLCAKGACLESFDRLGATAFSYAALQIKVLAKLVQHSPSHKPHVSDQLKYATIMQELIKHGYAITAEDWHRTKEAIKALEQQFKAHVRYVPAIHTAAYAAQVAGGLMVTGSATKVHQHVVQNLDQDLTEFAQRPDAATPEERELNVRMNTLSELADQSMLTKHLVYGAKSIAIRVMGKLLASSGTSRAA
jgi:hypothetical protein